LKMSKLSDILAGSNLTEVIPCLIICSIHT
jgi:hypothetical protein